MMITCTRKNDSESLIQENNLMYISNVRVYLINYFDSIPKYLEYKIICY